MKQLLYSFLFTSTVLFFACQKASDPKEALAILSISPDHGPAGTTVTIKGSGFSDSIGLHKVFFNGKEASIVYGYDSTLVATVPSQAGTGNVSVKLGDVTATGPVFTYEPSAIVSTFAGSADGGSLDGNGTSARFSNPSGIVKDAAGNFYVTDGYTRCVRKITPAGTVSTFARFDNLTSSPRGIAIDASGNLYVADPPLNEIYKVTPSGVVSVFAFVNAGLNFPMDVAVAGDGTLFVADYYNKRIARVYASGPASTFAGNGILTNFSKPVGVKLDAAGNVYVIEVDRIKKISQAGVVTTVMGSDTGPYGDGPAVSTRFNNLRNLAFDANGTMYIAEQSRIRILNADGIVKTIAGNVDLGFADGIGLNARFFTATALVFDAKGNLFVVDDFNNRIRKTAFE